MTDHVFPPPAPASPSTEFAARTAITCPLRHLLEPTMTQALLDAGGGWRCRRCSQQWDGPRLATVAAYAVWALEHDAQKAALLNAARPVESLPS